MPERGDKLSPTDISHLDFITAIVMEIKAEPEGGGGFELAQAAMRFAAGELEGRIEFMMKDWIADAYSQNATQEAYIASTIWHALRNIRWAQDNLVDDPGQPRVDHP